MEQAYSGEEPEAGPTLSADQVEAWIDRHRPSPRAVQEIRAAVEGGQPLSDEDLKSIAGRLATQANNPADNRPRYKPYPQPPDFEKRFAEIVTQLADKRRNELGPK